LHVVVAGDSSLSGLELLRNIRAMSPHVPVLILTAFGEWTTYIEALDCGCVDDLSKPVRREHVLMLVFINGRLAFKYRVDEKSLRRRLAREKGKTLTPGRGDFP